MRRAPQIDERRTAVRGRAAWMSAGRIRASTGRCVRSGSRSRSRGRPSLFGGSCTG